MKRPSPFEIMRRNRREREATAPCGSEIAWEAHRAEVIANRAAEFQDTGEWLRAAREDARRAPQVRVGHEVFERPIRRAGLLRRAFNYACGLGRNA